MLACNFNKNTSLCDTHIMCIFLQSEGVRIRLSTMSTHCVCLCIAYRIWNAFARNDATKFPGWTETPVRSQTKIHFVPRISFAAIFNTFSYRVVEVHRHKLWMTLYGISVFPIFEWHSNWMQYISRSTEYCFIRFKQRQLSMQFCAVQWSCECMLALDSSHIECRDKVLWVLCANLLRYVQVRLRSIWAETFKKMRDFSFLPYFCWI